MFSAFGARLCFPFSSGFIRHSLPAIHYKVSRFVCDRPLLKLEEYEQQRKKNAIKMKNIDDFWLRLMSLQDVGKVFEEDLKMAWNLVEEEHLPMAKKLSEMFVQDKGIKFSKFHFAAHMMRACHFLKRPDFALEMFNSPALQPSMSEVMTIVLLMDLLISSGKVNEAIQVYEQISKWEWVHILRNRVISMLYAVALYRLGTSEALLKGQEICKKEVINHHCRRKMGNVFGALALKLDKPMTALELIKGKLQCEISWNIKIQAHLKLDQNEDILRESKNSKYSLFQDTRQSIIAAENGLRLKDKILGLPCSNISLEQAVTRITLEEHIQSMPQRQKEKFV